MWCAMFRRAQSFIVAVIVCLALLAFLQSEYEMWSHSVACNAKCKVLGCKTGQLIFGQNNQAIACKCESNHDYLMPLN